MDYLMLMASNAGDAFAILMNPTRLMFLFGGVVIGLALGIIPGLGGIVGMALLLPFTFDMDKFSAFALLLGLGSVTATSDVIPAVLFGVPGTAGCAATILDGHPMARKGQAGRAFGICYTASLIGGLFGALLLAISIPVLRPIMLYLGSPELLSFTVFGLSMVSVLSGSSPMRGIVAACFGLLLAMIGSDPQTGTLRWTLDSLYLWDGLPLVPVTIGIFALPELADMMITRTSVSAEGDKRHDVTTGQWQGVKDVFRHWWLVFRCAWIGTGIGAIPGLGSAVVDWVAYGHAAKTEKGAAETFGTGDPRGIIASEASNNAKEGGALVPTIAFGVPGSASMALLLGAFLIHGLVPGPDMLTKNLDVTYSMVWSVALANILGAGLCFAFSGQFAKLALVRYSIMIPMIMAVVFVGAFQGSRQWGDIYTLLLLGTLGWCMKRLSWPRPPIILGVVLGDIVERYMFISVERYGTEWIFPTQWDHIRWVVILMFVVSIIGLLQPLWKEYRNAGGFGGMASGFQFANPRFSIQSVFYVGALALFGWAMWKAAGWNHDARIVPQIVGYFGGAVLVLSALTYTFKTRNFTGEVEGAEARVRQTLHLDIQVQGEEMDRKTIVSRALMFLGWLIGYVILSWLVGMLAAIFFFIVGFMKVEGKEKWGVTLGCAVFMLVASWFLFDELLALPWPQAVLGDWVLLIKDAIKGGIYAWTGY